MRRNGSLCRVSVIVDEIKDTITENIKHFREKLDVSQEKLSELCGYSSTYIGKIERGQRSPSLDTLIRISEALQIPLNCLFDPFYRNQGELKSDWDPSEFTPYDTTFRRFTYLVGELRPSGEINSVRQLPWFHASLDPSELTGKPFVEVLSLSSRAADEVEAAIETAGSGEPAHLNLVTSESRHLEKTTDLVFLPPEKSEPPSETIKFELFYPRIVSDGEVIPMRELDFEIVD